LHAFCAGLTAVLKPYQDALVQIEEQVICFYNIETTVYINAVEILKALYIIT
jgi:hypothetical protein